MKEAIVYNFGDNFIESLCEFILSTFSNDSGDFSRLVCVFGGKRPALFLRRELSKHIKKSFIPPQVLSIEEFITQLYFQHHSFSAQQDLDSYFLIYNLAKKYVPDLTKGRTSFKEFIPWAREIASFIEQLDLEDISNESLGKVEKSAQIGFEIPQNINRLLENIVILRKRYHKALLEKNTYSLGMKYLYVASNIDKFNLDNFDKILFCNLFYLHKTERRILQHICRKDKGVYIFQGDPGKWPVLRDNAESLGITIPSKKHKDPDFKFFLYKGFDIHSQASIARHILDEKIADKDNTAIIVPRPETVIPLLTEISSTVDKLNVSMGYPIERSSLYVLFESLWRVQESKKDEKYYTKDYLNLLKIPLVKNLKLGSDPALTRIIVHKIEEFLQGDVESSIGGSLFLSLSEIEKETEIYTQANQVLKNIGIKVGPDECKMVLKTLHALLFGNWENVSDFVGFTGALDQLIDFLIKKSKVLGYQFNIKIIDKIQEITEEFKRCSFCKEKFIYTEIWGIFKQKLQSQKVSFLGSPLKGLQVLGFLEARSLAFDNIIIMDLNEAVLPKLTIYEPLIPREIMLNLGLNRLEKEEEIQRYHFMRLISSAKYVYLIYEDNQDKEKSRFIEELLWSKQKQLNKLEVAKIPKVSFSIRVHLERKDIDKTPDMIKILKNSVYSASRINTYVNCPLQFYFRYVLGLKEKEELLEDPEASSIGNFIHKLLEDGFKEFIGHKPIIDKKFINKFFKKMEDNFDNELARRMKSDSFLLKKIIENRMRKFLDSEIERNVSRIICLEAEKRDTLVLNNEPVAFRYTVDRVDELEDSSIVVIDYKTGGSDISPKKLAALRGMDMSRESIKDNIKSFQLPLYYYFSSKDFPDSKLNAELYNIRTLDRIAFISDFDYKNSQEIISICLEAMESIYSEIIDPQMPFRPDKDERRCNYCSFQGMCV